MDQCRGALRPRRDLDWILPKSRVAPILAPFHQNRSHVLIRYGSHRRGAAACLKQIAERSIRRSEWRLPCGRKLASSIDG